MIITVICVTCSFAPERVSRISQHWDAFLVLVESYSLSGRDLNIIA